jgi:hypothetical protein
VKSRDAIRNWTGQPVMFRGRKARGLADAKTKYGAAYGQLVQVLANHLKDWDADGVAEATELMELTFKV